MKKLPAWRAAASLLLLPIFSLDLHAASASAGAAFLDIPVGAQAAALGSAYSALADNAYAPVWNPAGLGFASSAGAAAEHLDYLDSVHYEYLSAVTPLPESNGSTTHRGLGVSAQYLGSGDITRTDIDSNGNPTNPGGSFSNYYGSYNLAYGQTVGERLALGVSGKWINASLDDITANAYGADFGAMYTASDKLRLAATVTNVGSKLKFLEEGDALPLAGHAAAAYQVTHRALVSVEGVFPKDGVGSFHIGTQWKPIDYLSLRVGYQTEAVKELGGMAGFSAGLGLQAWGQEFAYAWMPYGDLGNAQYFSLLFKFGGRAEEKRNLIQYQTIKEHRSVERNGSGKDNDADSPESQQLMQILSNDDTHLAQGQNDLKSEEK